MSKSISTTQPPPQHPFTRARAGDAAISAHGRGTCRHPDGAGQAGDVLVKVEDSKVHGLAVRDAARLVAGPEVPRVPPPPSPSRPHHVPLRKSCPCHVAVKSLSRPYHVPTAPLPQHRASADRLRTPLASAHHFDYISLYAKSRPRHVTVTSPSHPITSRQSLTFCWR